VPLHVALRPRDPDQGHRAATPLELFFDLTFVVAVAQAASGLQAGLVSGHPRAVLIGYPLVFFAIWWAWMNFTWFASAYDSDDVAYRLAVLVQMTGVLILAAGVTRALDQGDFAVMVVGYVVMRLALVSLWLRAAVSDRPGRRCALRYAVGIFVVQIGWVFWSTLDPSVRSWAALFLVGAELTIPLWAEAAGRTSWHPGHIAERYGLFTIIVLGEALLAPTVGVEVALQHHTTFAALAPVIVGGLLIIFSMWWIYFDMPSEQIVGQVRQAFSHRLSGAFIWGYGHYFVFATAAATGSGLIVAIDRATHHSTLGRLPTGFVVTVPVATYLLVAWALHAPYKRPGPWRTVAVPVTAALILAAGAGPQPVLVAGLLLSVLVAVNAAVVSGRQPDPR
jgi:low temperature requirement protein LtrA